MQNKKVKLTWPMHTVFQRKVMKEMMTSADSFTDVTLLSDDKIPIKAHRNILSAYSPKNKNHFQASATCADSAWPSATPSCTETPPRSTARTKSGGSAATPGNTCSRPPRSARPAL